MTSAPALNVNSVIEGQPCWLVRRSEPGDIIHCPSAVVLVLSREAHVWHAGLVYDHREVFPTREAAFAEALRSAEWYRDYHRTQAARFEQSLRSLANGGGS
ncbi:MAG: hypothetical protein C0467_30075 [Planctomycetaceae bacterium]|nr:hypothetical protein [Planctomycetaceae bacterium]